MCGRRTVGAMTYTARTRDRYRRALAAVTGAHHGGRPDGLRLARRRGGPRPRCRPGLQECRAPAGAAPSPGRVAATTDGLARRSGCPAPRVRTVWKKHPEITVVDTRVVQTRERRDRRRTEQLRLGASYSGSCGSGGSSAGPGGGGSGGWRRSSPGPQPPPPPPRVRRRLPARGPEVSATGLATDLATVPAVRFRALGTYVHVATHDAELLAEADRLVRRVLGRGGPDLQPVPGRQRPEPGQPRSGRWVAVDPLLVSAVTAALLGRPRRPSGWSPHCSVGTLVDLGYDRDFAVLHPGGTDDVRPGSTPTRGATSRSARTGSGSRTGPPSTSAPSARRGPATWPLPRSRSVLGVGVLVSLGGDIAVVGRGHRGRSRSGSGPTPSTPTSWCG